MKNNWTIKGVFLVNSTNAVANMPTIGILLALDTASKLANTKPKIAAPIVSHRLTNIPFKSNSKNSSER